MKPMGAFWSLIFLGGLASTLANGAVLTVFGQGGAVPDGNAAGASFDLVISDPRMIATIGNNVTITLLGVDTTNKNPSDPFIGFGGLVDFSATLQKIGSGQGLIFSNTLNPQTYICIAGLLGNYSFNNGFPTTLSSQCGTGDVPVQQTQNKIIPPGNYNAGFSATWNGQPVAGTWRLHITDSNINTGVNQFVMNTNWSWRLDVQVQDLIDITCPANITVPPTSTSGALVTFAPQVNSTVQTTTTCTPSSGSFFPIGTTPVSCTATTASGSSDTCSFNVTVSPVPAPQITCPSDLTLNALSTEAGVVATFAPTVASSQPITSTTCSPPSGAFFTIGRTLVNCTTTNNVGLSDSCAFNVNVNDVTPPSITCPGNFTVTVPSSENGTIVNFEPPPATDNSGSATVTCSPHSGSAFSARTNTVTCTAKDPSDNTSSCQFDITVLVQSCTTTTYYFDMDGDGIGVASISIQSCSTTPPPGYTRRAGDHCPFVSNASQTNSDGDAFGDACDNCPAITNANQRNSDGDLFGDLCDNCVSVVNNNQSNIDHDSFGDACDVCVFISNNDQTDSDNDGFGDACDNCDSSVGGNQADSDGDGIGDRCDNCPFLRNPSQANADGDAFGDACDNCKNVVNNDQSNSDGDRLGDACDNCRLIVNDSQTNSDNDQFGDACDNCLFLTNPSQADDDRDEVGNVCDNCPSESNLNQNDFDNDTIGDVCDAMPTPTTPTTPRSCNFSLSGASEALLIAFGLRVWLRRRSVRNNTLQ